tara:strand:- start:94 stop:678 length:585 start_codon:yes stop_codon:yes gene_type:complete
MDILDKDILVLFALELDLPELLSLCRTSKRINNLLCQNNNFWRRKIEKEHPKLLQYYPTDEYKELYQGLRDYPKAYSVNWNLSTLKLNFVVKGFIEGFDTGEYDSGEADQNFKVGDKVWVMVNNRPDILFYYPQITKTRAEMVKLVGMEILIQAENNNEDDPVEIRDRCLEEMKTKNYIIYEPYEFSMQEMEIL